MSGRLQLAFAWDVTARSLLTLKLRCLEHVLQQRREILCMLSPVGAQQALHWTHTPAKAKESKPLSVSQVSSNLPVQHDMLQQVP